MSFKRVFFGALVIFLWMGLIFYLSHQPETESAQLSKGITEIIVNTVERIIPDAVFDLNSFDHVLRKSTHFLAYLILGLFTFNALRIGGVSGFKGAILALGICVLYAMSDEVHQLFVPGRGGQVMDVLIDSAGAGVGIGVYLLFGR